MKAVNAGGAGGFSQSAQGSLRSRVPGDKLWEFTTGGAVHSSPALAADGSVYFGSMDTKFYALKPDGTLQWAFPTGGPVDSSPVLAANGTIYFGSHDKKLYALKPDGTKKWEFAAGGFISSSPALGSDGVIYFGAWDKKIYALKPDGSKKWGPRWGTTCFRHRRSARMGRFTLAA